MASAASVVQQLPETMMVSDRMKNVDDWLNKSELVPIEFKHPVEAFASEDDNDSSSNAAFVVNEKDMMLRGNEVVNRHTGTSGSVVFVIRRPG